jgi:hypothetical protein
VSSASSFNSTVIVPVSKTSGLISIPVTLVFKKLTFKAPSIGKLGYLKSGVLEPNLFTGCLEVATEISKLCILRFAVEIDSTPSVDIDPDVTIDISLG